MNLTKLFNFKFMKQMLKKAKGQIILLLSIIPIFTFLILLMTNTGSSYEVLNLADISILNLIGMYVIPVILSINLFNYIYKSPSVDFINSMPINKKTIFASNTILGIILIVLMQLINVLGIVMLMMFKPNIIILPEIILDSFIIAVIGYIFVFTATNLAMCLSGNIVTQIAVTCLIVFLVPFTVNTCNNNLFAIRTGDEVLALDHNTDIKTYKYDSEYDYEYGYEYENQNILPLTKINEFNETMPYRYIKVFVSSNEKVMYDSISNLKTLTLAVIYIGIGVVLFEKRRFENVGDSFRSVKIHEFIKALTMYPMIAFINSLDILEQDIEIILFVYALLLVYFFVYDIITNKKQRFKVSILYILIIFVSLNAITLGVGNLIDNKDIRRYCLDDIESISINLDGLREYNTEILEYEIKDKELIEYIIKASREKTVTLLVRFTDGEEYYLANTYIAGDFEGTPREELITRLLNEEGYINKLKEIKLKDGLYTFESEKALRGEFLDEVNNYVINYKIENLLAEVNYFDDIFNVRKYSYNNHILDYEIFIIEDDTLKNKMAEAYNQDFRELLKDVEDDKFISYHMRNSQNEKDVYIYEDSKKITDIIKNDIMKVDLYSEYILIDTYTLGNGEAHYITNNLDLIKMYKDEVSRLNFEDSYYEKYNTGRYNDKEMVTVEVNENTNEIENIVTNEVINTIQNTVSNTVSKN